MKYKLLLLIFTSLLLVNCGTLSPELNTSGYKTLEKSLAVKKDGFNLVTQ